MVSEQDRPMLKLKDEEVLYILEVQLPEMLERNPELEPRAFRAFLKVFTTKEQTAAILAELREFRSEFQHFRSDVENRFEQIDHHLEQVDVHLEQIDRHFEQVDTCFEQIDRRLEQVDARFEQIDRRLEQVDARFEQIDRLFEQVDARFDQMDDKIDWLSVMVGRFQTRAGRKLEDAVAGALRYALKRPDIQPDQIRLRQKLVDEQGLVGPPGWRRFEIDIIAEDDQITVFEVKSLCEEEDVGNLVDKVRLLRALNPGKKVEGVMITLGIEGDVEALCTQHEITLINQGY